MTYFHLTIKKQSQSKGQRAPMGGPPDLNALAAMMGQQPGGLPPNLQQMMNNPEFMSMAQNMMQNGEFQRMMQNPAMMNM